MAGNGPLPKGDRQRERDTKRRDRDVVTVRHDGIVRGPELPADHGFDDRTVAYYETWRSSPQAQLFESTDWLTLRLLAPLVESHFRRPTAASSAEIRLTHSLLGGTHADRLRLRIRVEAPAPPAKVVSLSETRQRVRRRVGARALLRGDAEPDDKRNESNPAF